ncbi:hypothetical protein CCH79_00015887 [Gambusia affinis]|uniref:Uncharacterized protein n=1 Tax=Gambusia affinis TaxID=33528 RepID=A0A315V928_GAMAF|nr:hypothetical protein CCH79_00015887 [Gambusia affinis]
MSLAVIIHAHTNRIALSLQGLLLMSVNKGMVAALPQGKIVLITSIHVHITLTRSSEKFKYFITFHQGDVFRIMFFMKPKKFIFGLI